MSENLCETELAEAYFNQLPLAFEYGGCVFQGFNNSPEAIKNVENFELRPESVVLASYPKSGTTWLAEVLHLIWSRGDPSILSTHLLARSIHLERHASLWRAFKLALCDYTFIKPFFRLAILTFAQKLGLFGMGGSKNIQKVGVGTHLPVHLLPKNMTDGRQKLIYVARNPKDNMVSFYHFHQMMPQLGRFPFTWNQYFRLYMTGNTVFGSWFNHVLGYWDLSKLHKNVMFIRYEDMKKDLRSEVSRLSKFLDADLDSEIIDKIVEECQFRNLKKTKLNRKATSLLLNQQMEKFMRKGVVGDWRSHFTVAENRIFQEIYEEKMRDSDLEFDF